MSQRVLTVLVLLPTLYLSLCLIAAIVTNTIPPTVFTLCICISFSFPDFFRFIQYGACPFPFLVVIVIFICRYTNKFLSYFVKWMLLTMVRACFFFISLQILLVGIL